MWDVSALFETKFKGENQTLMVKITFLEIDVLCKRGIHVYL